MLKKILTTLDRVADTIDEWTGATEAQNEAKREVETAQKTPESVEAMRKDIGFALKKSKRLGRSHQREEYFAAVIDNLSPENREFYPVFFYMFRLFQKNGGDVKRIQQDLEKYINTDGVVTTSTPNTTAKRIHKLITETFPESPERIPNRFEKSDTITGTRYKVRQAIDANIESPVGADFFRNMVVNRFSKLENPVQRLEEILDLARKEANKRSNFTEDIRRLLIGRVHHEDIMHDKSDENAEKEGQIGPAEEVKQDFLEYCEKEYPALPDVLKVLIEFAEMPSKAILTVLPSDKDYDPIRTNNIALEMQDALEQVFDGTGIETEELPRFEAIFQQIHSSPDLTVHNQKRIWSKISEHVEQGLNDNEPIYRFIEYISSLLPQKSLSLEEDSANFEEFDEEKIAKNAEAVIEKVEQKNPAWARTINRIDSLFAIFHGIEKVPKGTSAKAINDADKILEEEIFKNLVITETVADEANSFAAAIQHLLRIAPFGLVPRLQRAVEQILTNADAYFSANPDVERALADRVKYRS